LRQRVALVATLARLYVGVVLIDRERECRGHVNSKSRGALPIRRRRDWRA
jgi:hypothetical protein